MLHLHCISALDDADESKTVEGGHGFFMQENTQADFQGFPENSSNSNYDEMLNEPKGKGSTTSNNKGQVRQKTIKRKAVPKFTSELERTNRSAKLLENLKRLIIKTQR